MLKIKKIVLSAISLIGANLVPVVYAMDDKSLTELMGQAASSSTSSSSTAQDDTTQTQVSQKYLFEAVFYNKIDLMKQLLTQDPNCVNSTIIKDGRKYSPLSVAVRFCQWQMVQLLLNNGAEIIIPGIQYNDTTHTNALTLAVDCRDNTRFPNFKPAYGAIVNLLEQKKSSALEQEIDRKSAVAETAEEADRAQVKTPEITNNTSWLTVKNMAITGTVTVVGILAAAGYYLFGTQVDADEEEEQE